MPSFLISIGAKPDIAGLIASVTLWVGVPSVLLLTRLSYRLGRRKPFLWAPSILFTIVSLGALAVSVPLSWGLMVFAGIEASIRFVTIMALPVEIVSPEQSRSASGLVMSAGYVGALVGPLLGGIILDSTGSYHWIFLLLILVSLATIVISLEVTETGRKPAT